MPLKHTTETLLVFILALALALTGLLVASLPKLPVGLVPWAIVFVGAALYPLSLSRLMQVNRADMNFRRLHFAPVIIALMWLMLQVVALYVPPFKVLSTWFNWGLNLPAVATAFFLLIFFCLSVVRRWLMRLLLVLIVFIPFVFGGVAAEFFHFTPQLTARLWVDDWGPVSPGSILGMVVPGNEASAEAQSESSDAKNLAMSPDPVEEKYRERLRAMATRQQRVEERLQQRRASGWRSSNRSNLAQKSSSLPSQPTTEATISGADVNTVALKADRLPKSGIDWGVIGLALLGGYCAAVHRKTCQRLNNC